VVVVPHSNKVVSGLIKVIESVMFRPQYIHTIALSPANETFIAIESQYLVITLTSPIPFCPSGYGFFVAVGKEIFYLIL
jgi:hypothetical protein